MEGFGNGLTVARQSHCHEQAGPDEKTNVIHRILMAQIIFRSLIKKMKSARQLLKKWPFIALKVTVQNISLLWKDLQGTLRAIA